MKVVVAAGGRFHALHLAHQLERLNVLHSLITHSYETKDRDYISRKKVRNYNSLMLLRKLYQKCRGGKFISESRWYMVADNLFDKYFQAQMKQLGEFDLLVGWSHYVLGAIPTAKKAGAKIAIECGSMHILEIDRIMRREYESVGIKYDAICQKNIDKILEEYDHADTIVVASSCSEKSFVEHGIPKEKIISVPYGTDFTRFLAERKRGSGKFVALFVGMVGLLKGVHYLIDAWKKLNLKNAELWFVGAIRPNVRAFIQQHLDVDGIKFLGSFSQEKLARIYQQASVFVFPSVSDGFGMVIAEAMASGLPVITTENTGACEILNDSEHGFILPIRDVDALAEKILWCYENREEAFQMGLAAQKHIQQFTWDVYGERIVEEYRKFLGWRESSANDDALHSTLL
ncbi:glycosyltransferase family 4 protein [bacterium]|nr:glycosyltransferase family 4 protein [bacterium]